MTHLEVFEEHQSRIGQMRRQSDCTRRGEPIAQKERSDFNLVESLRAKYQTFRGWFDIEIGESRAHCGEQAGLEFMMTHHTPNVRSILIAKKIDNNGTVFIAGFAFSFIEGDDSTVEARQHYFERTEKHGKIVNEYATGHRPMSYNEQDQLLHLPEAA